MDEERGINVNNTYVAEKAVGSFWQLRVGHVVVFLAGSDHEHNGTREHPALVTRVWGSGAHPTVNLKVLPDCGEPFDATSVQHWSEGGYPVEGSFSYRYREV